MKQDGKRIQALRPQFAEFSKAHDESAAAATLGLVDLISSTVSRHVEDRDTGRHYHGIATLGFLLGSFERESSAFTPGHTSTVWTTWAYSLALTASTPLLDNGPEGMIMAGLVKWAFDAGRFMALTGCNADSLRADLFASLSEALIRIFGPAVDTDHLDAAPPAQGTETGDELHLSANLLPLYAVHLREIAEARGIVIQPQH